MSLKTELDEFSRTLDARSAPQTESDDSLDDVAAGALEFLLENISVYSTEQLAAIYEHVVGEAAARGCEDEILGDVIDASNISLDAEMSEIIKLIRRMRANLGRQAALGRAVSNKEIRETLSACVTAVKTLTSHQKSVRTMERQRVLENTLIEVLGELSEETQQEFQIRLRERLEEDSQ